MEGGKKKKKSQISPQNMSCQLVSARRDLVRFLLQTITGNQRGKSWVANLAQWPKRDKNTNARFVCVGEKARQARIAHKVPRIPGGAGGRHVPSGKLIMTQRRGKKKKKKKKPERTSVSKAQKMRRWMRGLREREHTQTASFQHLR